MDKNPYKCPQCGSTMIIDTLQHGYLCVYCKIHVSHEQAHGNNGHDAKPGQEKGPRSENRDADERSSGSRPAPSRVGEERSSASRFSERGPFSCPGLASWPLFPCACSCDT